MIPLSADQYEWSNVNSLRTGSLLSTISGLGFGFRMHVFLPFIRMIGKHPSSISLKYVKKKRIDN